MVSKMEGSKKNGISFSQLSDVAAMYYLEYMSQEEIAQKLFVSRSTISRMLKQAREEDLVSIKINFASGRNHYYETKLAERFGIDAIVINSQGAPMDEIRESICREFAQWFDENLHDNDIVGATRGTLIHQMAGMLKPSRKKNVSFVQLMGTEFRGASQWIAQDVIRQFAAQYQAKAYFIDAPLVFFNETGRQELLKSPSIHQTLQLAKEVDLVLTTLPTLDPNTTEHIWKGFIARETYDEVLSMGGIGCIFGRAFDSQGKFLDIPLNHSIVSADAEMLKNKRIAAACFGSNSAYALLGALRGSIINVLITDSVCTETLLFLDK